jgi:hypothetical protein
MEVAAWTTNDPGDNPVCIVGAGFQLAVLEGCLPSTKNIIPETVSKFGNDFPALRLLDPHLPKPELNFLWTHIYCISQLWQSLTPEVIKAYDTKFINSPMGYLVQHLKRQPASRSSSWLLWMILGVELKRMLALQYDWKKITLKPQLPPGLCKFIEVNKKHSVTWVSLNYEMSLETFLDGCAGSKKWRYAFQGLFEKDFWPDTANANHVVVKPHGSLNVWFTTSWEGRPSSLKPNVHEVFFADRKQRLKTCVSDKIGVECPGDPSLERRPWLIGYLPDELKHELNTPAVFSDTAHDLCKWNMTHAALAIQKASSLYILGYRMPDEDLWVWSRLAALPNKKLRIYVASKNDSDRIVDALKGYGFNRAKRLSKDGGI